MHSDALDTDDAELVKAKLRTKPKLRPHMPKQDAFLEFKHDDRGKQLEESIVENRDQLKSLKIEVKELTEKCNAAKKAIDSVKADLDKKQEDRKMTVNAHMAAVEEEELFKNEDGDMPNEIIDEEELKMLQQMKMLKKTYRAAFAELRGAKSSLSQVMQTIDVAKQQLVAGFEAWYDETFGPALA